ncbi:endonuclease/exonuclease/phosphatase family protein [Propionibacteriaceae bacterium Y1700]|uniref:endonuclease/exonuclease/phosphatase family protein n=1 Tax=Microlunatus sp. Y1700 TaxID=3418487 RepID=UPI003DA790F6
MSITRRGLLGATTAGALALTAGTARAEEPAKAREVTVRVATYNIHAGANAEHVFDIEPQAEALAATGAEIIGLQEVDHFWAARSNWIDEVQVLADALGMRSFFGPILDEDPPEPGRPRRQFGCAILSQHPMVLKQDHQILRYADGRYAYGHPQVRINVRGAEVDVFNSHLDYRGDPAIRIGQIDDILRISEEVGGQQLLLGDLNAKPEQPEMAPLFDAFSDGWLVAGSGDGFTFPAQAPDRRIDYVLTRGGPRVVKAEIPETLASDHRPLVADVVLRRGRHGQV